MSRPRVAGTWVTCLLVLSAVSCQTGPPPAKMGTPEWFWTAAREQYAAGDFVKTQEHLSKLMLTEGPYRARAAAWHLAVLAGMARAHLELADAWEAGAPDAKANTAEFRRRVNDHRRESRAYTITLAEELGRFLKDVASAEKVTMEFAFPIGSAAEPPGLNTIRKGFQPPEADRAAVVRQCLARGILLQSSALVGEDPAKAAELFKTQPVEVPRAVFLHGLGDSLVEQSALFNRKKLQEPDKKKILLDMAASMAKSAAEAAQSDDWKKKIKDLQAKIEKEQKNIGKV